MANDGRTLLTVTHLSRRFGGLLAVDNLDFEVHAGEIFGLIGPNGAGKSTTFSLISGFISPTTGKVTIDGKDMSGRSALWISRAGLVRTFQHNSYVKSMTVRDNIRIGTIAGVRHTDRSARAEDVAKTLGLGVHLDTVAGILPHGVQRLVSMGIAIAAAPKLLCLDEPLTGLNETEVATVLHVLSEYRHLPGCAVLLVEHNMKAVMQICDRLLVLHHGAQLFTGGPREVRINPDVIQAYLGERHAG